MRNFNTWGIVIIALVLIDLYVFNAVRSLASHNSEKTRLVIYGSYLILSAICIFIVLMFPYVAFLRTYPVLRIYIFAVVIGLFFAKIIAAAFFLLDDVRRGAVWLMGKIFPNTGVDFVQQDGQISRSVFLSWLGIGLGGGLFASLLLGFGNKYNYQIKKVKLVFENLPAAFKGLKIVQVSDIHSGSFTNKKAVSHGVDMILRQNADLILFTGDLVNNAADEMKDYIDVFSRLKAPMGVFSTLGNHDYGDYTPWPKDAAKQENLDRVKNIHAEMGWRLLMNEHIVLEKNNEQIALLGVENWSALNRFPKHGRLDLAYAGAEKYPFKILMSHDPSHWDAQVRPGYPDIDLTLSGHTHGMQFGVELPHFQWSPVQWVYKEWAGLYENGRQKLYVNPGYGFIGYPGRVGILPEITVIELG
jgi:predicted MPP superfamily phosphohydrolase